MSDFRNAKDTIVLVEQERVQDIIDKMIVHIVYCDMEVMTAGKLKTTLTDLVAVSNSTTYCAAYHTVQDYVERFIDENDSYVEMWDGASEDLIFMRDILDQRRYDFLYKTKAQVRITIEVR